eukprot:2367392-Rhodomonas_salina.2
MMCCRYPGAYGRLSNASFESVTLVFRATDHNATLRFDTNDTTSGDRVVLLDEISVAVLEGAPASWTPLPGVNFAVGDGAACAVLDGEGSWRAVGCNHTARAVCQRPRHPPACRWDELLLGDRCVWIHTAEADDRMLDRAEASAVCQAWGGNLLTVKNENELAQIGKMPRHGDAHIGLSKPSPGKAWAYESGYRMSFLGFEMGFNQYDVVDDALCVFISWRNVDYGVSRHVMVPGSCELRTAAWLCEKPALQMRPPFAAPKNTCSDMGGLEKGGWCYWFAPWQYLTFHDARHSCKDWGGDMAIMPGDFNGWGGMWDILYHRAWAGMESLSADQPLRRVDGSLVTAVDSNNLKMHEAVRSPMCGTTSQYDSAGMQLRECDLRMPHFVCRRLLDPATPPPPPAPTCDATDAEGRCWLVLRVPMSFDTAAAACYEWGGALSAVHSPEQQSKIDEALQGVPRAWLGLRRGGGEW